jgi:CRP/FNR family cyclic AMP-dependent transcriptional regulator
MERSPLFRSVGHDTLDALLERARVRTLRRGTAVTRQGIEDDQLQLVVTGWLKRHRLAADGREIVLDLPSPGEVIGLIEVLDGRPPCHGATTLSTTDLLAIPGTVVRRAFQEDTAFAVAVARVLVETLRTREHELVQLTTEDARTRVAARLVDLAEAGIDETGALPVQLSQEELASWAGISRESAAKTLHDLRERSIVRTGRRRIVIDDLESLREVAAAGGAGQGAVPPRGDGDPLRAERSGSRPSFERRLRLEQVVRIAH